jgi:nitrous oxidase accessory protein NosD
MSYTLKGRLQSRLVAALVPVLVACVLAVALPAWWPVGLVALMLAVGLGLDVLVYDLLDYQPGWAAVPLGLLELGLVMALVWALDWTPPLVGALALFAGAWLVAQVLAQAGFPLLRLSYAEDGGELGRAGLVAFAAVVVALATAGSVGWAGLPPTVRLAAGVHQGPLVLDRAQTLVGEPGAVVRDGIVIRADHVVVRNVTVEGGENGIEVQHAHSVLLDRVVVRGARMDGIHVRRGRVTIRNCTVQTTAGGFTQGIDISFSHDWGMSVVEDCVVLGGREGIVTHSAAVHVKDNEIRDTSLRAIAMTEMSMGAIDRNHVSDALGVGIFCGDYSECEIRRNRVRGTRPDHASGDYTRLGVAVEAHYEAKAELHRNDVAGNPTGVAAFVGAELIFSGESGNR